MTTLILVRHGHVDWIAPPRFRGRAELPLTGLGLRQAEATARHLRAALPALAAIYTSPLGRCRDTAEAIAGAFGLTVDVLPGLNDLDYGAWQGLTHEEARAGWPAEADAWFRVPHLAAIPGGETLPDLVARVAGTLHQVLARHGRDATVVLVGHDSVNRAALCHVLGLPPEAYRRLRQDPCALNELRFDGRDFAVALVNGTQHLAGA